MEPALTENEDNSEIVRNATATNAISSKMRQMWTVLESVGGADTETGWGLMGIGEKAEKRVEPWLLQGRIVGLADADTATDFPLPKGHLSVPLE
jgi:hypothetical protein